MTVTNVSIEQRFLQYMQKMMHLKEATSLMFWDMQTSIPKMGAGLRAEAQGTLSSMIFDMTISSEMKYYLDALTDPTYDPPLSPATSRIVEEAKIEYNRNTKIPADSYKEYMVLKSISSTVWDEAKKKSDFTIFQPYLEKLVKYNQSFIQCWGMEGNPYDALLQIYDPGISVEQLDLVTKRLKEKLLPLLKKIESKAQPDTSFLYQPFPRDHQKTLIHDVLKEMGYDFRSGRLDESAHAFAIAINRHDVRITTKFVEDDFTSALYAAIHEGGHALYEQNISPDLAGTPLGEGASWGMHESQSLFWEKLIVRHPGFSSRFFSLLKEYQPDTFCEIEFKDFYRAIHVVKPSLIRVEADELTYPFHVMIRYEIEKGLFQDEIEVKELPRIWNDKMKEYVGIQPPSDREGVLQDIHWSIGLFGQFPSYLLGFLYAAQFRQAMIRDLPNLDAYLSNGQFSPVREWLTKNIHRHGRMKKPDELLLEVTGEELNPDHLIRYFYEKYTEIYQL